MNFNDLLADFARIPQVVEKAKCRHVRQQEIEESIVQFRPDFLEMHDMLDAFSKALELRYEQDLGDIEHEMKQLKEQLQEADATQEAYERQS